MTKPQIIDLQKRIGAEPDGFWGPRSIRAVQLHLTRLMPTPVPWPKTDQKSLTAFYGAPGDEDRHTLLNVVGRGVSYDGSPVKVIRCHSRIAASLDRVIARLETFEEGRYILARYDGCYNNRPMRGGSTPSLHARAAAIDFDAGRNGNKTAWPVAASMSILVMEEFAREGWIAAGAFWGRDGMHFQATA